MLGKSTITVNRVTQSRINENLLLFLLIGLSIASCAGIKQKRSLPGVSGKRGAAYPAKRLSHQPIDRVASNLQAVQAE